MLNWNEATSKYTDNSTCTSEMTTCISEMGVWFGLRLLFDSLNKRNLIQKAELMY